MSFNIRYGTAPDGQNAWPQRRKALVERIRKIGPDLLGVQECRADGQLQDLAAGLPEYDWYGAPRGGDSDAALEMAPVFFRRDRFQVFDRGISWLSETPEVPGSLSWGSALPRTLTWMLLHESDRQFWFANTHFDHFSWDARLESAAFVAGMVAERPPDEYKILTGDFNTSKDTDPYRRLTAVLPDPFRDPRHGVRPPEGSFHGYGLLDPPEPIDWILASPGLHPEKTWVEDGRVGERWLSDHHPVAVIFRF